MEQIWCCTDPSIPGPEAATSPCPGCPPEFTPQDRLNSGSSNSRAGPPPHSLSLCLERPTFLRPPNFHSGIKLSSEFLSSMKTFHATDSTTCPRISSGETLVLCHPHTLLPAWPAFGTSVCVFARFCVSGTRRCLTMYLSE